MPIGEFSQRSGLSPRRLRSYAASGFLVPAAVDATSGYRYYSPGQLRDARVIDLLREAGMSLADIGLLLRNPSEEVLSRWARQVELEAARRQQALDIARDLLAIAGEPSRVNSAEYERTEHMMTLATAARTDIGQVRDRNEDAMVSLDRLAAVADGMGGAPGGDVASAIAVALVESAFTGRSLDELEAAVRAANKTIWDRAVASPDLEGMGTTVCALGLTRDERLGVVNVGDSRAYLWRDGSLQQLTQDHSVTAELVRRGELTDRDAADHPYRCVLTRALGVGPTVEIDGATHALVIGDRLVVCTDGLFNEVPDEAIAEVLATTDDVRTAADALVERALSNGGRDNVSVVVAEVRRSG